jgi:hypothetical protein
VRHIGTFREALERTTPSIPSERRRPAVAWSLLAWADWHEAGVLGTYFTMADPPRRVNFVPGLLVTAEDLAAEQDYHRSMRYLTNRLLHGYGTVCGMAVEVRQEQVHVGPGIGIDLLGREIVVTEPLMLPLEPLRDARRWVRDLVIEWHESPADPAPGPDGDVSFTRWVEHGELVLAPRGKGPPEGLLLARLTRTSRVSVDVDSSVRRPLGPA